MSYKCLEQQFFDGDISLEDFSRLRSEAVRRLKAQPNPRDKSQLRHTRVEISVANAPYAGMGDARALPDCTEKQCNYGGGVALDFHTGDRVADYDYLTDRIFYRPQVCGVRYDERVIDDRTHYWREDLQAWSVHPPKPKSPPSTRMRTVRSFAELRNLKLKG